MTYSREHTTLNERILLARLDKQAHASTYKLSAHMDFSPCGWQITELRIRRNKDLQNGGLSNLGLAEQLERIC